MREFRQRLILPNYADIFTSGHEDTLARQRESGAGGQAGAMRRAAAAGRNKVIRAVSGKAIPKKNQPKLVFQ